MSKQLFLKNYILFLTSGVILFAANAKASELDCQIKINTELVTRQKVNSKMNEKVKIGETQNVRAYVTENSAGPKNLYTIEVFLSEVEARIYAEGVLNSESDHVTLTYWGRDQLLDVTCQITPK